MKTISITAAAALALAITGPTLAEQSSLPKRAADTARPADSTANLPSDSGSQTTLPSGAVTGAGHPEGVGRQPDVGAPGGLEPRARQQAREQGRGIGATGPAATGTTGAAEAPDAR
jgi:hypothetical protein